MSYTSNRTLLEKADLALADLTAGGGVLLPAHPHCPDGIARMRHPLTQVRQMMIAQQGRHMRSTGPLRVPVSQHHDMRYRHGRRNRFRWPSVDFVVQSDALRLVNHVVGKKAESEWFAGWPVLTIAHFSRGCGRTATMFRQSVRHLDLTPVNAAHVTPRSTAETMCFRRVGCALHAGSQDKASASTHGQTCDSRRGQVGAQQPQGRISCR